MYLKLEQINIWPSRELLDETMPQDFKDKDPSTRVIIDCMELQCHNNQGNEKSYPCA